MNIYMLSLALLLGACGRQDSASQKGEPGAPKSAKTRVLEAGAAVLQHKAPVDSLDVYLDGFHFRDGNMTDQMEAHHYCSPVDEDLNQCVIFDGNTKRARIMGVEYVVSARVFAQLSAEEKKLWHSHVYEVKSGELVMPGLPGPAEKAFMEKFISTYGKTWHMWNGNEKLPFGKPALMMGFTADGQIRQVLIDDRDRKLGVSTVTEREQRADLAEPKKDPAADAWEKGKKVSRDEQRSKR